MRILLVAAAAVMTLLSLSAHADDAVEEHLNLKDHAFVPREFTVPAGQKIKLILTNQDPTPAEFESYELHREKTVAANGTITFFLGPLDAGSYPFFDDFHHDTTTGTVIAK